MRFTMKRTLALVLALMLTMPTFVLADGVAVAQDANGQITANELALNDSLVPDDSLLPDGDLVLDDLSLELPQPDDPTGDLELGSQDPSEGDAGEQPDASEAGASGESPLELGDDAQVTGEEIPDPQPLMPPEYALDTVAEGENVTDPALAANDDVSTWEDLRLELLNPGVKEIDLIANCERDSSDKDNLVRVTNAPQLTLNLNGYTMGRNDLSASTLEGYVIKLLDSVTINGQGTIKGGNNDNGGGGIIVGHSACKAVINDGTITDNKSSGNSTPEGGGGAGGGVDIESGSFTMTGGTIEYNSAVNNGNGGGVYINDGPQNSGAFTMTGGEIKGNSADGNGGGVYINFESIVPGSFTMTGGEIKGNSADGNGGGVYVDGTFSVGETNKTSTIQISGNKKKGQDDNNVYLTNGKLINVNGKLSEQSDIGVTTENKPNGNNGFIPITNSFSKDFLSDVSVFKSDDTQYAVGVTEENGGNITLGLGCKIEHTSVGAAVVYDGQPHGIKVNVTKPDSTKTEIEYKVGESGQYKTENPTFTKKGSYDVYYKVSYKAPSGEKPYCFPAEGKQTVTITPNDVTLDWKAEASYTYNGQGQGPDAKIASGIVGQDDVSVTVKYKVKDADDSTLTDQKPVDAGDYVAVAELSGAAKDNYSLPSDSTKAFTIMKVSAVGYKGVYDGKAHGITVTVTGSQKGHTVKYGEKEGTYDKDSLTYTDAGVYTVYYQITAKNYVTATGSAKVEITPKELDNDRDGDGIEDADSNVTITLKPAEYTYDGKAKKPLVTVTDKETGLEVPLWEFKLYYSNNVDIGTAKVTISDAEGGNYVVKGVKTFTIKGAPMTVAAKGYEGKYDGEAHGITVTVIEPGTGYTIKYGTAEGTYDKDSLTYTDVGVYTVYYQVTAEHYETVTGSATVEITANKKTSMTVVAEDYKGEYDREAHGITVTVTEPRTGYTVKYSTVDGTYDKDSLTYTDVGVYTVYYQVTAENYETVTGSATVEITARVPTDLTIDLSGKTYYYYAKARKPTVTVKDGDTVVPESEYRVTYKNNIHAGTATVKITSFTKGNYSFAEERNFTIKPRNVHLKYTKLTFTYDGKYHLPLAKAIGVYPADENKYTVQMTGSGRNVGRYIARTTGIDNPDYHMLDVGEETRVIFYINPRGGRGSGSGNARFVAEKKIGTEEIGTVTYDGKAQEPKFEVKCIFNESNGVASNTVLTVPASEYKVTYSNNVDVGKATVEVTDVPGGNFEVNFRTSFTIARRKATVTANDQRVKTVDGVKTGVNAVKAKGLAKGHVLESVKLDISIKEGAKKGAIIPGKVKIVDAEGKDVTRNYKIDYVAGSLAVASKPDFTLLAQMKACGGDHTLRLTWTQVPEADGYELTFVKEDCSFTKAKSVSVHGLNTWKFTGLKKNTAYKAYVRAWKHDGNKRTYIGKSSPTVCAITGNVRKHNTNADSVRVDNPHLKLNVGERAKVGTTVKGVKSGKDVMRWEHALLRWYSDDANVATVNARGEIRAVAAGECTIYALAANGIRGTVKVKVK